VFNLYLYRLVGHEAIHEPDFVAWETWVNTTTVEERTVARTTVGAWTVITSFLAVDHRFGCGPPQLFESVVLGKEDEACRYTTWEEAEKGHEAIVQALRLAPS
jgi:hypothetical protein